MSTRLSLSEIHAGATVTIPNIRILGSTRRDVLAELDKAERFGITIELTGHGTLTGPNAHARRVEAIKPLVAGRITRSASRRNSTAKSDPFIFIGDHVSGHHFDTGSRHVCWCGKSLGRRRLLNETAEREIVEAVVANGGDAKAVAEAHGITVRLVTMTMNRYGYVRSSRAARSTGVVAA